MELTDYRDKPADELRAELMEDLVKSALYAIRSNSGALIHECYGMVKAYRIVNAIKIDDSMKLGHVLVSGWMNAGEKQREAYAGTVTAEDIRAGRNWRDQ